MDSEGEKQIPPLQAAEDRVLRVGMAVWVVVEGATHDAGAELFVIVQPRKS